MTWKDELKKTFGMTDTRYAKDSKRFLDEIKAEGGALGKKHLMDKFNMNISAVEMILNRMIRDGLIFRHKDGDLYTHDPVKKEFRGTPVEITGFCRTCRRDVSQGDTCVKRGKRDNPQLRNVDTCPMKV